VYYDPDNHYGTRFTVLINELSINLRPPSNMPGQHITNTPAEHTRTPQD
jgi:hypothetical protein